MFISMMRRSRGALVCAFAILQAVPALAICASGNDMVFQCAVAPDGADQITVCRDGDMAFLSRHTRDTGAMYYDPPLIMDPTRDYYVEEVSEGTGLSIAMGFWDLNRDTAAILQFRAGWDDEADDVDINGPMEMWVQSPDWQQQVDQVLCRPNTVQYDPDVMFELTLDRGPVGQFYSTDNILPEPSLVGRARVSAPDDGIPVYAISQPNASTPRWARLYDGWDVDVIDRMGDFSAVALTQGVVSDCVLRPDDLFQPYIGPCSTGWVETKYLEMLR